MDFNLNTDLIAIRTLDVGYILSVLTNPKILDDISEDGFKIEMFKIDVINDYWVELLDGDLEIGVAQFKPVFSKMLDCHIHILPEHRKKYSKSFGTKLLEWADLNLKGSLLYTTVPVFCENVKNYLLSFDFKESGLLEKAWTKNGKLNDMWILTKRVK